jgi:hypothetical protein
MRTLPFDVVAGSPRLLTAEIRIGAMLTRASGHSLHAAMDGML